MFWGKKCSHTANIADRNLEVSLFIISASIGEGCFFLMFFFQSTKIHCSRTVICLTILVSAVALRIAASCSIVLIFTEHLVWLRNDSIWVFKHMENTGSVNWYLIQCFRLGVNEKLQFKAAFGVPDVGTANITSICTV